jgi:hypothetical protein
MPSTSKLDAVRLAKERLGEAPAEELADFIEKNFGLRVQPAIVAVLLASLRERESLERSRQRALEEIERARAEQPQAARPGKKGGGKPPALEAE